MVSKLVTPYVEDRYKDEKAKDLHITSLMNPDHYLETLRNAIYIYDDYNR